MPEPLICRYLALVEILAAIDGFDVPDDLPRCAEPATFSTFVVRKRDGQDVEIYTRTCASHDEQAHVINGYVRSIGLRQPKPDATS